MCKDSATEQSFFSTLQNKITSAFNLDLHEYNSLRPHIDRLALQNSTYRGPSIEGATSMITNRVNGAYVLYKSPQAFYNAGLSGFKWAYYFSLKDNLSNDVRDAGMAALYSHLWPLSLTGITKVAVTGWDVSRGGGNDLAVQAQIRYEQQRNALLASTTFGLLITQVFKKVGTVVRTDMQRTMVRGAMRTWQGTGILGICYGLSLIHKTMEDSGVFGSELTKNRDDFIARAPSPELKEFKNALPTSGNGKYGGE